ncbi:MAG: hypothetical protein U9R73_00460 [Pseudomonadota bacterium]|nr:hypothetical protein [Pseudomonadota bacterium]
MAETIYLVEATPRNPGVGTVTVRLSSKRSHARDVIKNNLEWKPALDTAPAQTIKLLGEDQLPGILEIDHGSLGIVFSPDLGNDVWSQYQWDGAALSVWRGESGGAFGTFTKVFTGRCGPLERPSADVGALPLRGAEADLDKDLLTATYAGTGAAEGDLALKGAYKPWMSGPCEGVAGVLVSKVYWVWQLHGYGAIDAVTAAYEGGLTLGASSGDYASYAALIAATIPDGGWATCLALGLVRLKNEPSKPVVFDARGAKDGATYVSKVGAIATHLIKQAGVSGGSISATSASNLDAAFPHDWNFYTATQTSVGDVVRKAMADIGGYAFPDENGIWRFGRYKAIKSASTLTSRRTALPLVQTVSQKGAMSPVGRVEIGARRCWTLHREDDISPALLDAISTADAAAAAAQAAADAAQATNSVNLYRVETAGVVSSKVLAGAGAGTEIAFGHANGSLLASAPASDPVAHIILADNGVAVGDQISVSGEVSFTDTGSTMALRVRFTDAAGAQVGIQTLAGIPGAAAWTKMQSPSLTVPAGAVALHVSNRTNGGTGTAGIRNVMVNRGPICAPYSPPTRGATSNVDRGAWSSASVVYSVGDEVQSQGSTWGAKVGHVSSGGNGPPALPTTENTNWRLRAAKGDAGASGTDGDPGYTLNVAGNVTKVAGQPASLNCAVTAGAWGSGSAYSSQVFMNGAALWFNTPNTHGSAEVFMLGLNDDPSASTSYTDIDHALYFRYVGPGDYRTEVRENGTVRTLLVGGSYRPWSAANKYGITYDGRFVRYWEINGTTATKLYENDVGANKAFGLDVAAYARLSLTNIAFSPKGADGLDAVTVSPPSVAYNIACDSAGNPKAGEFNKVTTFSVLQGTVDLSDHADTDYSVANTNCSATMGGTNGKVLTQTAMSAAAAKSVVTIQRNGVTVATVDVSLTKALEGAASRRALDTSISAPSSTSYGAANGGPLEMALNTGETANVSFGATYTATSAGTFFVSARIEYREKGSGTWLLLDSEAAGSAATYLGDPGDVSIFADLAGSAGLKVYEFQLLLKRSNTGPTMSWNPGNFLVSVF